MKASTIFIVLNILLFCSCTNNKMDTGISGTYVTKFQNEYSMATDTLIISEYSVSDKIFNVDYRAGFKRIRDGVIQPKEFKRKQWKATWDSDKHALTERESGHQLTFISYKPIVLDGDMEYHKVK
jgi:hypothetical protein